MEATLRPASVWKLAAQLLAIAALAYSVYRVRAVIAWILIALVLSLALDPLVGWMQRRGLRRGAAVLVVAGGLVGLLTGFVAALVPLLVTQIAALADAVPSWVERVRNTDAMSWLDARLGIVDTAKSKAASFAGVIAGSAVAFVGKLLFMLAGTITVLVLTVFMLVFGPPLVESALEVIPRARRATAIEAARAIERSVGGYVAGSIVVAAIGGTVTGVSLLVLGVPFYLALGLAMVVLGLVPYIGSLIGGALVVLTTFLSTGLTRGLIALAIFVAYQQLENHVLQPLVQRRTIRMNPLLVALAMLVGTAEAGVLGAALALPVAGAIQVIVQLAIQRRREAGA